jgi:hypothetical protein
MNECLPDGFLLDGLTLFNGPGGGYVAGGFRVDLPDLAAGSFAAWNQAQDAVALGLRQLPEGWSLQVRKDDDHSDGARLQDYQAQTEGCAHPVTRLVRNTNFVRQWQRLERRELRRQRVLLFVGRPLDPSALGAWRSAPGESRYRHLLAEARGAFQGWEQTLGEALHPIGGRVAALSEPDYARVWMDAFNPSFSEDLRRDAAADFRFDCSLLDNCWLSDLRGQGRQGFTLDGWPHLGYSLKRLSSETFYTLSHRVTQLPFGDVTVVAHVRRLRKERVLKRTQQELERIHRQLQRQPDERLAVAEAQLREKQSRLAAGEVVPLEFELILIARARTVEDLMSRGAAIKSAILGMNAAQPYEATLATTTRNLFAGTLPGWMWRRQRGFVHYVEDRTAADLLPLGNDFCGHPGPVQALFDGTRNNLVNVVCLLGEGAAATAQNLIILGLPGTGKSLMLLKLLLETALHFGFTAIVEEGMSQAPFPRSLGVEPIVFRLDGTQTINLFDTLGLPLSSFVRATITGMVARMVGLPADEDKARRQSALIARHVARLCADHAEDQLRRWPEARRQAVVAHALALHRWGREHGVADTEAFVDFREWQREHGGEASALLAGFSAAELREFESTEPGKVRELVFAELRPEEHLTLSSLQEYFLIAEEDEEECRWLATLLTPWCRGGNVGVLFDGASNVSLRGAAVHFELGLIPEAAKEVKAVAGFLVINGLRQHILSLPKLMTKRIVIEEISRFLDVPGGEAILRELAEQFRKHRCQLIVTAQSYSRIADTSIRVALVGNARAFIIGNTGDRRDILRLAEDIGLSQVAVETICHFPRPDQQVGAKYSEFLYWHTDVRLPICGPLRYVLLPHELEVSPAPPTPPVNLP